MRSLLWVKSEDGYKLHSRNNISWGSMIIDSDNNLIVSYKDKIIRKNFKSYKVASNVSNTVAERLSIKSRSNKDDDVFDLPGKDWEINVSRD